MEGQGNEEVTIDGITILRLMKFKYLGPFLQEKGNIDKDINHHSKVGPEKCMNVLGLLCDKRIPVGLKGEVYSMVVKLLLLYGSGC